MMNRRTLFCFMVLCLIVASATLAVAHNRRHSRQQHQTGMPGNFDYYVLTLSWSPEFCHGHSDGPECQSGHYGFIVHGLWPQFIHGYPENCSNAPGPSHPSAMLDIMPDEKLIEHEWVTHGTCSGLSADEYFNLVRQAYKSVNIPAKLAAPTQKFLITPENLKRDFLDINPKLSTESMAVSCGNNYLTGMHVCLTKGLQPIACSEIRDCRANQITVIPVR